jgi:SAM-dependent methyltransferase
LAQRFGTVHDRLVERLAPQAGERWLDVATGTGGVAIRAAAAGADVTGVDIAPGMLEGARAKAPGIEFELGDCQELRYEDGSFEVVSSCFGFIFAPDHAATAREVARVCRGRIGFTCWEPNHELGELYGAFGLDSPEGRLPFEWGKRRHIEELLATAFELEIESYVWTLDVANGEASWDVWSRSSPPFKTMVAGMDEERRAAFRLAYIEYSERFREGDEVRVPRPYLLVVGTKR